MAVGDGRRKCPQKVRASRKELMEDQEIASRYVKFFISPRVPNEGAHLGTYRGEENVTVGLYT